VVFLGDSMATQTFQAFVCFLHSTVESPVSYHLQFQMARIFSASTCPYGSKHCELVGGCVLYPDLKIEVCLRRHQQHGLTRYTRGYYSTAMEGLGAKDIAVVNMGLWYGEYIAEASDFDGKYQNDTRALADEMKAEKPMFLWQESTPQHFPRSENGYFQNKDEKMYDVVREAVEAEGRDHLNQTCTPYGNRERAFMLDHRNRAIDALHIPTIPLWAYLWNLSDAHLVLPRRRDSNRWNLDCTHWCLPGPLYRVFPSLLLHSLQSHYNLSGPAAI